MIGLLKTTNKNCPFCNEPVIGSLNQRYCDKVNHSYFINYHDSNIDYVSMRLTVNITRFAVVVFHIENITKVMIYEAGRNAELMRTINRAFNEEEQFKYLNSLVQLSTFI